MESKLRECLHEAEGQVLGGGGVWGSGRGSLRDVGKVKLAAVANGEGCRLISSRGRKL